MPGRSPGGRVADTWVSDQLRSTVSAPMRRSRPGVAASNRPRSRFGPRCGRQCPPGSDEVDRGQRHDLVVEGDREALGEVVGVGPRVERGGIEAALGDPLGHPCEGLSALVAELHRHQRGVGVGIGVGLGVLDVEARQLRVVLQHREALDLRRLVGRALLLDHHYAPGTLITREPAAGRPTQAPRARRHSVSSHTPWRAVLGLVLGQQLRRSPRAGSCRCAPARHRGRRQLVVGRRGSSARLGCVPFGRPLFSRSPEPAAIVHALALPLSRGRVGGVVERVAARG